MIRQQSWFSEQIANECESIEQNTELLVTHLQEFEDEEEFRTQLQSIQTPLEIAYYNLIDLVETAQQTSAPVSFLDFLLDWNLITDDNSLAKEQLLRKVPTMPLDSDELPPVTNETNS